MPVAFFNCAPVQFSVQEARITESSSLACERGEEIKCRVNNGWGTATCAGAAFDACQVQYCDPGYDLIGGACVAQACTPQVEVACSKEYNLNLIGVGVGSCTSSGSSAEACDPWVCVNGYTKEGTECRSRCNPGEIRQCAERNGFGSQICEGTGTAFSPCVLNTCEAGFVYDPDNRICKSTMCTPSSTLNCQTEWGPGTRTCTAAGTYSPLCDPTACPLNFTKSNYSCWPNICTPTQVRNAEGLCVDKAVCAVGSGMIVVNNTCVCPTGMYDINGVCGTCQAGEVYEPIGKKCSLDCQLPLVKVNNQCVCGGTNQVLVNNQCVSNDIGCTLTADSLTVPYNGNTNLNWTTLNSNRTSLQCTGQSVPHFVAATGSENYSGIKSNSTCDLIATNLAGTAKKCSIAIAAMAPPTATCDIAFSKNPANYNDLITATLTGANVDSTRTHVVACGTKSTSGSTLPLNLSLGAVTNNLVCTGKVYNLAGTEANCSSALTVTQPGAPGCTLAFNPSSIYNTQGTTLVATFANTSAATLACPNMSTLNGNVTPQDGTIRTITSLSQALSCTLTVQNIAGVSSSCTASITPQTAPIVKCNGLSFSKNPVGMGDSVIITAAGENIDPARNNKITCGGTDVPLTSETATILQASLDNITTGKSCTATLYNVIGQSTTCLAQTLSVVPNPTCTSLVYSKNPAVAGDTVSITVNGNNIDTTKLNQIVCNGQSISLATSSATRLTSNLTNVQSNQSCSATLYNSADKSVQCAAVNLTVNAPAQCSGASFDKSLISIGETATLTLTGTGIDTTRAPLVNCGGGALSFGTKTSSSFSATYTPVNVGTFNCNVTLYSSSGAALACPAASITNSAQIKCNSITFSKNPSNIGETITVTANGSGIDTTKSNTLICGGNSIGLTTKTTTSIAGSLTAVQSSSNCTATVYNSAGASASCASTNYTVCSSGTSASGAQCVCNNGAINAPSCDTCATGKIFIGGICQTTPTGSCSISVKSPSGTTVTGATAGTSLSAFWSVTNGNVSSYTCTNTSAGTLSGASGSTALTMGTSALSCTLNYQDLAGVAKSCSSNSVAVYQCNPGDKDRSACTQPPANGYSERTCSASGTWGTCVTTCNAGWTGSTCSNQATVTKWCRFTTRRDGARMGINGCSNGGLGPAMTLGWLHFELATGFKKIDPNTATCVDGKPKWHYSFLSQDYTNVVWKNSTQKFNSTGSVLLLRIQTKPNGSSTWGINTSYTQLTTWHKQSSVDTGPGAYFCNYDSNGKCIPYPSVKAVSGGEGQQKYNGVDPYNSPVYLNYASEGSDGLGTNYRMIWQESSPGPNCYSPGTVNLDANFQ